MVYTMHMTGQGTRFGIGLLVLGALLYIGTLSFVSAMPEEHNSGCEIAIGGASLCIMSSSGAGLLTGKLTRTQPTFDPTKLLLAASVVTSAFLLLRSSRRKYRPSVLLRIAPIPLYTLLFLRGILNPKAP